MAHLRCDFHSESLGFVTCMEAFLPDTGALSETPVVWLLHGLGDNATGWSRLTAVERYARACGAAVIMPEVQRSFYTDMALGPRYFTFVREELPAVCRRMFGLSPAREKNYVMGLSMGGYGALKCAFRSPERYMGCASFSGAVDIAARARTEAPMTRGELMAIFGPELTVPEDCDLFRLLEKGNPKALPRFFMTCGEQDGLYAENCRLASALTAAGADSAFRHFPGDHTWDLWDKSLAMAMEYFFGRP